MARLGHKYSVLGITEPLVEAAVSRVQAFWAKGAELQQAWTEFEWTCHPKIWALIG